MRTVSPTETGRDRVPPTTTGRPALFVVLAYLIAWAWAVPLAIGGRTVEQGQGWPTHVPSLLAPLLAALIAVGIGEGWKGVGELVGRIGRWRFAPRWWLVVVSPMIVLGLTVAVLSLSGSDLPSWGDFAAYGGLPEYGVVATFLLVLVLNGVGEEAGWRGYLQDRLQARMSPIGATLVVAAVWAVWHTPFFFALSTYRGFEAITLVMFPLGLASGAVVLTWLYNNTGRSILAAALWHALYNMTVATAGSNDVIQGAVTSTVMVAAALLVSVEIVVRRRGRGSVLLADRPSGSG